MGSASAARSFSLLVGHFLLSAFEGAYLARQCIASAQDNLETVAKHFDAAATVAGSCIRCIQDSRKCLGRPFAAGQADSFMFWIFLHDGVALATALVSICNTFFPKGKKQKSGSQALRAARVSLRTFVNTIQAGLSGNKNFSLRAYEGVFIGACNHRFGYPRPFPRGTRESGKCYCGLSPQPPPGTSRGCGWASCASFGQQFQALSKMRGGSAIQDVMRRFR